MENLTVLSKAQQIKLLKKISYKLAYALDNLKWEPIYTNYFKENVKEERNHLKSKPENVYHGLTANEGGLYFAVKQIVDYLEGEKPPDIKSYIFMRKTVFIAYSLVAQYSDIIKNALKDIDHKEVLKMDHCDLVK